MAYETLIVESRDGVATVTVNRPEKLNALSDRVMEELDAVFAALGADASVRGVILTGAGEKAFVAGADIGELATQSPVEGQERSFRGQRVLDRIERLGKPVVAAVGGFALGGGCELALACDLRIASERAKLGQPEILLGIIPGGGGTQRLARLIGPAKAKDMILTGRQVGAEEALRIGLVDEVVAPDALHDRAYALAAELAQGAVVAQGLAKRAIDRGLQGSLAAGIDLEHELFAQVFATEDARIGVASFLEHGPGHARFVGR